MPRGNRGVPVAPVFGRVAELNEGATGEGSCAVTHSVRLCFRRSGPPDNRQLGPNASKRQKERGGVVS
jgi:hypothetical protein